MTFVDKLAFQIKRFSKKYQWLYNCLLSLVMMLLLYLFYDLLATLFHWPSVSPTFILIMLIVTLIILVIQRYQQLWRSQQL
ncbi:hypothetical protein [Furfurilactobacillus milii]|uniref:Uncharacterized protein n=1 Tax=Furfurilactobacillus rossiae TaxID=231049 RepID=A0A7C9N6M4_9LACO|nr:hypothetical protein [Furfurilactobacillus milii]MYV05292.1 hypothetical protein [Furfurilactobacillus milii]